MLAALTLALLLPATRPANVGDDPPIKVRLDEEAYSRGDRARVRVKAAKDGYLVVFRADGDGRIRILYPLNPEDRGEIRGGKDFEVRGRGDREAFTVDERQGTGTVLAAWSDQPFHFDEFDHGGHWDYRALAAEKAGDDPESALLDIVERISNGRYDYDVETYGVSAYGTSRHYAGWYGPGLYGPWYWPYYYPWGCYGCGPVVFRGSFGFGFGHGRGFIGGRHR